jgi:hypothetical protein
MIVGLARRWLPYLSWRPWLVLLVGVLTSSCSASLFKPVYPVKGQVLFEGKPATGATVFFLSLDHPDDPLLKPMGNVDESGFYTLSTYKAHDGAPAGAYAVTLFWLPRGYRGPVESANKLPARYRKPETSGIKVHVAEGDNHLEPFKLAK